MISEKFFNRGLKVLLLLFIITAILQSINFNNLKNINGIFVYKKEYSFRTIDMVLIKFTIVHNIKVTESLLNDEYKLIIKYNETHNKNVNSLGNIILSPYINALRDTVLSYTAEQLLKNPNILTKTINESYKSTMSGFKIINIYFELNFDRKYLKKVLQKAKIRLELLEEEAKLRKILNEVVHKKYHE